MRRAALLALLCAACARDGVGLYVTFDGDAGLPACDEITEVACVNFLAFDIQVGDQLLSNCVKVQTRMQDLCDIDDLADGMTLFEVDPGEEVTVHVTGRRIYPATGCQTVPDCPPIDVFYGTTAQVRLGDVVGGRLPLSINDVNGCGPAEAFFPRKEGETCEQRCGSGRVVCDISQGCVCRIEDAEKPDAGPEAPELDAAR